jgi:molybdate transport system ATP-binding protein
VGYVFQEGRLLPHLTVRHNLAYGRFFNNNKKQVVGFEHAVELLGLGHLLERRPGALSGGEKQRVAIGRALLANPEVLLLDEPLASLDAPRKAEILYYVERLRDELRIPIVYVSHSLDEVVRLANSMVLMSEGKVLGSGEVREMMSRVELRPYLGRHEGGAVIEARVAAQDLESGLARLEFSGGALEIPDVEALPGEQVRIRVRARDVSIALARPAGLSIRNVLAGTVVELADDPGVGLGRQPVRASEHEHGSGEPRGTQLPVVVDDRRPAVDERPRQRAEDEHARESTEQAAPAHRTVFASASRSRWATTRGWATSR